MKVLLEEDSDEIFEFLDKFSSRTFADIENEEEINEKLTSLPSSFQDKWEEGGYKTFSDLQTEYKEETEKEGKGSFPLIPLPCLLCSLRVDQV